MTEELLDRFPPPAGGRCIDIGCGFGETTQRLAELVGPAGFVLGTDSSPRFIEDARREAAEAGVGNVEFEVSDAQTADWEPAFDYAFSRMGTQFFAAPVPAMRAIRGALVPGGALRKIVWRRKDESPLWAETEKVVLGLPLAARGVRGRHLRARARSRSAIPRRPAGSSRPRASRRSSCISATSTTTWAATWTRRSTRCSRSGRAPS